MDPAALTVAVLDTAPMAMLCCDVQRHIAALEHPINSVGQGRATAHVAFGSFHGHETGQWQIGDRAAFLRKGKRCQSAQHHACQRAHDHRSERSFHLKGLYCRYPYVAFGSCALDQHGPPCHKANLFAKFLGAKMSKERLSVFVTRRLPDAVEKRMAELFDVTLRDDDVPLSREALAQAMKTADVLVPTITDIIDAGLIGQAGPNLKLIAHYGAGVDNSTSKRPVAGVFWCQIRPMYKRMIRQT